MADRSPDDGPGNHRAPSIECCWTSVDIVGGWVHAKRRVAARSPAPWRTCQNADVDCNGGGTRSLTGPRRQAWETTGPPLDVAVRVADISVLFLVPYRGKLKRPHLHCQADAVA